jgi:hypothetical protein
MIAGELLRCECAILSCHSLPGSGLKLISKTAAVKHVGDGILDACLSECPQA